MLKAVERVYSLTANMANYKNKQQFISLLQQDLLHMKQNSVAKSTQHSWRVHNSWKTYLFLIMQLNCS